MGGTIRMKFRTYGMILSLLFALGIVFSFGIEASADHPGGTETKTAADTKITSETDVRAFLDHIIEYYNDSYIAEDSRNEQDRKLAVYGRQIREEGTYKDSDTNMYSMGINEDGIVTNHPRYPSLYGYKFVSDAPGSAVASTIQDLISASGLDKMECKMYGAEERWACAIEVDSPSGKVTVIAGLHHAENDSAFIFPDCTDLLRDNYTSAMEVTDKESLKNYVEDVIKISGDLLTKVGTDLFMEHPGIFTAVLGRNATDEQIAEAGKLTSQRLFQKIACLSNEDPSRGPVLNHGAIYSFIMGTDPAATVLINGNNPALNGLDLQVNDPNPIGGAKANIAELIHDAVTDDQGELKLGPGDGAFVEYHWDDPTTDADNNEGWFERQEVPGNSRKISYVRAADINVPLPGLGQIGPPAIYIFGSGIYPMDSGDGGDGDGGDGDGGDGGCAIAGVGNTSQATLLNLLLTASVLFSVVFLRRRI